MLCLTAASSVSNPASLASRSTRCQGPRARHWGAGAEACAWAAVVVVCQAGFVWVSSLLPSPSHHHAPVLAVPDVVVAPFHIGLRTCWVLNWTRLNLVHRVAVIVAVIVAESLKALCSVMELPSADVAGLVSQQMRTADAAMAVFAGVMVRSAGDDSVTFGGEVMDQESPSLEPCLAQILSRDLQS